MQSNRREYRPARLLSGNRFWLSLLVFGLFLASNLIWLAHPVFFLGAWGETQPMVIGLWCGAALCLAGLTGLSVKSRLARRSVGHPMVLAFCAIAAWSVVALPFSENPWRSVFGVAQTGQGVLWYVAFAACIAAAIVVQSFPGVWCRLIWASAVSSLVAAILALLKRIDLVPELNDPPFSLLPRFLQFNEYLAYPALGLTIAACVLWLQKKPRSALLLAGCCVVIALAGRNRSQWLSLPLLLAVCWWGRHWLQDHWRRWFSWGVVAAGSLLPTLGIALFGAQLAGVAHTLWSRSVIFEILLPPLLTEGTPLLVGRGWGAVPEQMAQHLASADIHLYGSEWGGVERDIFHSHNAILEALVSVGLPGACLAVLLPVGLLLSGGYARRWIAVAFVLSWGVLDSLWFMIPASLPFIAIGCGAVIGRPRAVGGDLRWLLSCPKKLLLGAGAFVSVLLVAAACASLASSWQENELRHALLDREAPYPATVLDIRQDGRGSAAVLTEAMAQAEMTAEKAERFRQAQQWFGGQAENYQMPSGLLTSVSLLSAQAFLPPEHPLAWADEEGLALIWEARLRSFLRVAPQRIDVLSPYFNWLLARKKEARLVEMVTYVKAFEPSHPVLVWFEGILLLQDRDPRQQATGLVLMRQAVQAGLERFMPLAPEVKQVLQ
ncbi:O-antigen ligase family protein [Novispirillum itersonii]|uniref:O-antigen ligase family protein n=1 Tax=Novispirillum itersonii TaxID=189 RepID=UPI0003A779E6|nr:hypothetical protein [Novispirillum itersonii]